jgi:hypothetical protein
MTKTKRANNPRLKIIRAAILSVSLLSFLPLFTQIRPNGAVASPSVTASAVETSSTLPPVSTSSYSGQSQATSTTQQTTTQTHARTRGS